MSRAQIEDLVNWHEQVLADLKYPAELAEELRQARHTWISKLKVKK